MGLFSRRAKTVEPDGAKGVDISYSDDQNWQRNLVSVRTVTYSGGFPSSSYSMLYRRQPAVRAAVDFLARNIGQLNAKVYERVSNTDRLEVSDHPLAQLLHHPNSVDTRYNHQFSTVADIAIYNRAYWRKFRTGRTLAVARISPETIAKQPDGTYQLTNGERIARSGLVVFPGYTPDSEGEGVSPLETLRRVLAEESAAVDNRAGMWANATRLQGTIERPAEAPEWSDTARERFRADWEGKFTGSLNSGRAPVLEDGMKWNDTKFEPPTDDYIAGRRLTYEEAAIAYGIPPSILGMTTETKSNAEQYHRQVYQDVLGPWLRMLQDEIELQLLPDFEPMGGNAYVEFNLAEKLKGSFEEQGKTLVTAVGVPYMTVNEGRARLNLPTIDDEWADKPVQPLNVMYGGQPAVTVPTADPSTASAGAQTKAAKAAPRAAIRRRDQAAKAHQELFERYFERQRKSLQGKASSDRDRWDSELTADLYLLATTTARKNGNLAAEQIDGVYDEARTLPYLAENARIAAEGINAHTFDLLEAAEDAEARANVFDVAKGSRSEQLGLGRATMLIAFAREEAARHSTDADGKARTKTWVVTAGAKSRHPGMNGQTVPVGQLFSNGMKYPHDGANGSAAQVAGCKCLLQLSDARYLS